MKRILIINPFGIGDVLFSTVLFGVLKDNFPQCRLYYICNKRTCEILQASPDLKKVFVFEKKYYRDLWKKSKWRAVGKFLSFLRQIKKEHFDIAFDLSMGHQYGFFLALLGVPERVGFNYKNRGRFFTKRLEFDGFNDKPIAEYYLDLARLLNLKVEGPSPRIWVEKEDEDYITDFLGGIEGDNVLIFGIAPGGGVSFGNEKIGFKRWDAANFAELADRLIGDLNGAVILIWGPGEEHLVKEITTLMKKRPLIAPPTTIRQMAALMKKCDVVICNDSGPLHVAAAAGSRTVSIFGPSDERVYGPYPATGEHLVITKEMDCRPCYKKFRLPDCKNRACLRELSAESVFSAAVNHIKFNKINET